MANAEVRVAIVGDNSSLSRSLDQSQSKLASFGAAVGKIALAAGIAAAGGLAILGKASVDAASDAQQSLGATETVFGKYADTVVRQSKRAATALGLSADEYRNNANILGSLLGNQGVATDELAGKTRELVKMGADLAATFGGTTTDAVNALASAFKGEFDPLEQYGISIKQSAINTEAYRVAGVKTKAAFDDLSTAQQNQAKQQATTNLLTKQASKSQGAFARETDTLAHQQQVLNAQWENLKARLGKALLPAVTDFVKMLNDDVVPAVSKLAKQHLPALQDALSGLFDGDPGAQAKAVGDGLREVDWGTLASSAGDLGDTLKELGPALADISIDTVNDSLSVFAELVGFAADHIDLLRKALPFLVAGYVALKSAQVLNAAAGRDSIVGLAVQWATTRKLDAATKSLTLALREMQVAQAGAAGAVERTAAAEAVATGKTTKLGAAARGAAGAAGLGLLVVGASTSNDSLSELSTTAGAVATGFSVGGPWGAAIGGAVGLVMNLAHATDGLEDSMASLSSAMATHDVDALDAAIAQTKAELDKANASTVYGTSVLGDFGGTVANILVPTSNLTGFMGRLTGKTDDTAAALSAAEQRVKEMRDGTYEAGFAMGDFAYVMGQSQQAAQDEADALEDATNAMRERRREASRGLNAELDYQAAIDDANKSLRENGKTVDKTTEKGRANLRSLTDLADAWNNQSDAAKNARGSLRTAQQNFVDTATKMGMAEGAAKRLADKLFEIPPKREPKVRLDGVEKAVADAKRVADQLFGIKDQDVYVTTHYTSVGKGPHQQPPAQSRLAGKVSANEYIAGFVGALQDGSEGVARAWDKVTAKIEATFADRLRTMRKKLAETLKGDKLDKAVDKAEKRYAEQQREILRGLRRRHALLIENGKAQDANTKALEDATKVYDDLVAKAEAVRASFVSFGDIGQLGRSDTGKVSLSKLLKELRKRAADAAEFAALIQQLAANGLDQTQIDQLTSLGPEQALATARAIASGGAAAIKEINDLSRSIAQSGGTLGTALADQFSKISTATALQIVDQLEAEQKRLDRVAENMAKALVKQLQHELGKGKGGGGGGDNGGGGGGGGGGSGDKGGDKGGGHTKRITTDAAHDKASTVTVKLTSQQVSQLERGREIQLDLDAYHSAGGRSRR